MEKVPNLYAGKEDVNVLTEEDFDLSGPVPKLKAKGKCGYLKVYAHWCHYCKIKVDDWSYFATVMKPHKPFTICVAEESTIPNVARGLGVQGFPSFYEIMEDGSLKKYDLEFSLIDLMHGLCKNQGKFCGLEKKICAKNKKFCYKNDVQVGGDAYDDEPYLNNLASRSEQLNALNQGINMARSKTSQRGGTRGRGRKQYY